VCKAQRANTARPVYLSLSHTHTLSQSLSLTRTHSLSLSLSAFIYISLALSLSHTHTGVQGAAREHGPRRVAPRPRPPGRRPGKSTCHHVINFEALSPANSVTLPADFRGNESPVVHRVGGVGRSRASALPGDGLVRAPRPLSLCHWLSLTHTLSLSHTLSLTHTLSLSHTRARGVAPRPRTPG